MEVKNRLKSILQELGIRMLVPTSTVLTEKLGGMSLHRFNKLLHNTGPNSIRLHEVQLLTTWLSELTGQPKSAINLLETEKGEEATC